MKLRKITDALVADLHALHFAPPVEFVYNPLEYARSPHRRYLERYGTPRREVLLIGMNPGPWGMAQTGVPFGAVSPVREWLGIDGEPIGKPPREHPKRPIEGFACRREEVSGVRLWGWARDRFATPERFFARFFVANYCPLLFLDAAGRNLTPDRLKAEDRRSLLEPCDRALRRTAEQLGVRHAIGIGAYAEQRAREALAGLPIEIGRILHPSPANPAANRGWAAAATRQLQDFGIRVP